MGTIPSTRIMLLIVLLFSYASLLFGQDTIVLNRNNLDHSIAKQFTIYESSQDISVDKFLSNKNTLKSKKKTEKLRSKFRFHDKNIFCSF